MHHAPMLVCLCAVEQSQQINHGRRCAAHQPQCLLVWLPSRCLLPRFIGLEVAMDARHLDEGEEEDAEVALELARERSGVWI